MDYCLFSSPVKLVRITASKETYSGATLQNPTYSNFVLLSSHAMMLWVIMKESISLCPCYNYILGFFIWHFSHMSVAKARIVSDHICGTCEGLRKVSLSLSYIVFLIFLAFFIHITISYPLFQLITKKIDSSLTKKNWGSQIQVAYLRPFI